MQRERDATTLSATATADALRRELRETQRELPSATTARDVDAATRRMDARATCALKAFELRAIDDVPL